MRAETAWAELVNPTLCVEVSINNRQCYGDALRCQLYWAQTKFSQVTFSVGDILNAYTYEAIGHPTLGALSATEAVKVASAEGLAWIEESYPIIRDALPEQQWAIMRWQDWRSHPRFASYKADIAARYLDDHKVRTPIQEDVYAFYARRSAGKKPVSRITDLLAVHTIEELAVYRIQYEEASTVLLYPGSVPLSYHLITYLSADIAAFRGFHYRHIEIR